MKAKRMTFEEWCVHARRAHKGCGYHGNSFSIESMRGPYLRGASPIDAVIAVCSHHGRYVPVGKRRRGTRPKRNV